MSYKYGTNLTINIKESPYNAVGDGVTDDTTAIQNAISSGGSIYFPNGKYLITSTLIISSDIILQGENNNTTSIVAGTSSLQMIEPTGSKNTIILLQNLTLDFNQKAFIGVTANGAFFDSLEVNNCIFTNGNGNYIVVSNANKIKILDTLFEGKGAISSTAIAIGNNCADVDVERCTFRGLSNGVYGNSTTSNISVENIRVKDCEFDFMYYSAPASVTGSGAGVSYTYTALTDTTKNFTITSFQGTPPSQYGYIRAMPIRASGTITSSGYNQLTDSTAQFLSDNIVVGEIVRAGTAYAIISSIENNTTLNLEGWLDQTTAVPTTTPGNIPYTVYGIILGKIGSNPGNVGDTITLYNPTGLTVWLDLNGSPVIPANGTLYEIVKTPNYPISFTASARKILISGNTIKRSFTDAISPFGNESKVHDNTIIDCQDMGITIDNSAAGEGRHVVHDNLIVRQGTDGIYVGGDKIIVHDNIIKGYSTRTSISSTTANNASGIGCEASSGTINDLIIHHNIIDPLGSNNLIGIAIVNPVNCKITDNHCINCSADVMITGSSASGTYIKGSSDNIIQANNAGNFGTPNGQILDLMGYGGIPENRLLAGVGSLYLDGYTGLQWLKASGTNSSGWIINGNILGISSITSNYNVVTSDNLISVGILSAAITITLPLSPIAGQKLTIKDANGSAATYNIIISGNGKTIDGSSSVSLYTNYSSIKLIYNGNSWSII